MTQPIWSPSAARVAEARLTRFIAGLGEPGVYDYPSLYAWSLPDPESFWAAVWRFCGVVSGQTWDRVLEGGDCMPGARWFPGATLNFAENLMGAADLRPALVFRAESGERRELSRADLHREMARLAAFVPFPGVRIQPFRSGECRTVPLLDDPLDDVPTVGEIVFSRRHSPQGMHVIGQQHPGLNRKRMGLTDRYDRLPQGGTHIRVGAKHLMG